MLIKLKNGTKSEVLASLTGKLDSHGLHHCVSTGDSGMVVGLERPLAADVLADLNSLGCISECISMSTPWKLVSKAFKKEKTQIKIKDVIIGGSQIILMAGPCAIESEEQLRAIALACQSQREGISGLSL